MARLWKWQVKQQNRAIALTAGCVANMLKKVAILTGLLLVVLAMDSSVLLYAPLANAADLQTIKRRGRLVVAVKDNLRPLGFRNAAGQLEGFEIDVARRLAAEILGSADAVEFRPVLNQDRFKVVLDNEVDLAIANVSLTPSRLRILSFSIPYYQDGIAIATPDPAIQAIAALSGKPVVVLDGSNAVEVLQRALPGVQLVSAQSYEQAKALIDQGQAIAVAANASVLAGWVQEFPQYRLLVPVLSSESLCVILPKGGQYSELRQQVDFALIRLRNSGWLAQQAQRWGLPVGPRP